MKRLLLALIFLLACSSAGHGQTNTFCASNLTCTVTAPWTFSATGTTNAPLFNVAQTGSVTAAGALNGFTEGCALQSIVFNVTVNINQCVAGGGATPSLPLYVQANPSGSQSGNGQNSDWAMFSTIKGSSLTGLPASPAAFELDGYEAESFYTGTLGAGTALKDVGVGAQVYIDNTIVGTTAQVPFGISMVARTPFYNGNTGTGRFVTAYSLRVEQPPLADANGNAVGTSDRAAIEMTSNFATDPVTIEWQKTGANQWNFGETANASSQTYDFFLGNFNFGGTGGGGFRFQNIANGNAYINSLGTGQIIFNGKPTFAGEGTSTNATGGAAFLPGGASGSVCTPSTSGVINICNNTAFDSENAAASGNYHVFNTDTSNNTNLFTHGTGTALRIVNGASTPLFTLGDDGGSNGHAVLAGGLQNSGGAATTLTGTGACATFSGQVGGQLAGSAACASATAASTLTLGGLPTAAHGYVCNVQDETTRANLFQQTSHTTTSCTLTATSVTQNDVFVFTAIGF